MEKTNILFVCKYNRFRSKIANAYFRNINNQNNVISKSAGLIKGRPLNPVQIDMAKNFNITIQGETKSITSYDLDVSDIIVIVADDVPEKIFKREKKKGVKVINWKLKDAHYKETKKTERLIAKIMKKVEKFNNQLK